MKKEKSKVSAEKKSIWQKIGENLNKEKTLKAAKISFNILAIFAIAIFAFSITPKELQNDTFYTIKIGEDIRKFGIDFIDHYSWHNLPYTYPHWLYDFLTALVFDFLGGYTGIYVVTCLLSIALGIALYITNKKYSKNEVLSFVMTMIQLYGLQDYVAARAQLVTFILFVLTIYFIESFLKKEKVWKALVLLVIPTLIANLHIAVWPFYFVLYLPYVAEYIVAILIGGNLQHQIRLKSLKKRMNKVNAKLKKAAGDEVENYRTQLSEITQQVEEENVQFEKYTARVEEKNKKAYKVDVVKHKNLPYLIMIMLIALLTGLCTPLRGEPYTYTYLTAIGNTMSNINEHLPMTLADNHFMLIAFVVIIALLGFAKSKIKLRDLFFIIGLSYLALSTRRQESMFIIFCGFIVTRLIAERLEKSKKYSSQNLLKFATTEFMIIVIVVFAVCVSYLTYVPKLANKYVSNTYPIEACEWIKENIENYDDTTKVRFFNDYNYGSYILLQGIPVFIDSRADLYAPEFNGEYNTITKKYDGKDIFSDYLSISAVNVNYNEKFNDYGITHILVKSDSRLALVLNADDGYVKIYGSDTQNFVIYRKEVTTITQVVKEEKEKEQSKDGNSTLKYNANARIKNENASNENVSNENVSNENMSDENVSNENAMVDNESVN